MTTQTRATGHVGLKIWWISKQSGPQNLHPTMCTLCILYKSLDKYRNKEFVVTGVGSTTLHKCGSLGCKCNTASVYTSILRRLKRKVWNFPLNIYFLKIINSISRRKELLFSMNMTWTLKFLTPSMRLVRYWNKCQWRRDTLPGYNVHFQLPELSATTLVEMG